jgi:TonB family protein
VLSGPEELRQAGLQTALQGKYSIDVARNLQVLVDFKLPAAGQRQGTPRGQAPGAASETGLFSSVTGNVSDSSRNFLPGVTITIKNNQDTTGAGTVVITDAKGDYRFPSVPPGTYTVSAQLTGFRPTTFNNVILGRSQQVRLNFALQVGTGALAIPQNSVAPAGQTHATAQTCSGCHVINGGDAQVLGPQAGARGQRGGQPGQMPSPPPPPPTPGAAVRVGRNIAAVNLITKVPPVYPPAAQQAQVQGVVDLEANINKEGRVTSLIIASGHPLLVQAAIDAVKQWVYRPVLLNGQPVDVVTTISVTIPSQD